MALGKLTKIEVTPTPAMIAELEEFALFAVKPDGEPALAGYYDRRGKLRRIVTRYPDGWKAQINIDANGFVTSSSVSMKLAAQIGGANV